jgi:flagellin
MRELAVQSANGTNSSTDRANLDAEYQALDTEIGRLATSTTFNGLAILDADAGDQIFQIGANKGDTLKITTVKIANVGGDIKSVAASETALDAIDTAIDDVASDRADYGAASSRFNSAIKNLQIMSENTYAARGRIMDADFAVETANMTRASIMQQAGTAMVAQANQIPNGVLSLLG